MPQKFNSIEERREYNRAYYHNSSIEQKKRIQARHTENKTAIRNALAEMKSQLACMICGFNHPAALDFHHRDPKEKDYNIGQLINKGWTLPKMKTELEKCVVLCSNCHRIHHDNERKNIPSKLEGLAA